jgi:glutamine amidotransferase-like uncharacterized protein
MKRAEYFSERLPPGYTFTFDYDTQKLTFTCGQNHTKTIGVSSCVNNFSAINKALRETPPRVIEFCGDCRRGIRTAKTSERWSSRCVELGFSFISHTPSTRKIKYVCSCGNEREVTEAALDNPNHKGGCYQCSQLKNRRDLEDLRAVFVNGGCILLETEYTNNKIPLRYKCSCGQESTILLADFNAGKRCLGCAHERAKQKCMQIYGVDNPAKSEEVKERGRQTCLQVYGVEHHSQHPEVQARKEATCMNTHGVTTVLATPEVQQQAKAAMIAKYGVAHGLQIPSVMETIRQGNREKYGTDYPFQSQKFWNDWKARNKTKYGVEFHTQLESWKVKVKEIMLEKYGSEYFVTSEEMKRQMLEKYGVKHCMQSYEVYRKAAKSMYSSKDYVFPSGRTTRVMGYEWCCLDILLGKTKSPKYTGQIYDEELLAEPPKIPYRDTHSDKDRVYFPDICVFQKDSDTPELVIEVKSMWTFNIANKRNHLKFIEASKTYRFQVWIFSGKKQLAEIITYDQNGKARFLNGKDYHGGKLKVDLSVPELSQELNYGYLKEIMEEL